MGCSREPQYVLVCKCLTGPQIPAVLRILFPDRPGLSVRKELRSAGTMCGSWRESVLETGVLDHWAGGGSCGFWGCGLMEALRSSAAPEPCSFPGIAPAHLPPPPVGGPEGGSLSRVNSGEKRLTSDWVRKRKVKILWYWPYVESKIMVQVRLFTKERHRCRKQS